MSYGLELDPEATFYQEDEAGQLRAVRGSEVTLSRPFFSAPGLTDEEHDQGDEPAELGEGWIDLGYTTDPAEISAGALVLPAGARVFTAPVGTPPPGYQAVEWHVDADGTEVIDKVRPLVDRGPDWSEGPPIGPPIKVHRVDRPDGSYMEGYLGPAHPAYDAVRRGLTEGLSVDFGPAETVSDNGPYVRSGPAPAGPALPSPAATVASLPVNGLGREHIDRRRHIPRPQAIGLGDVVAGLFGAELTGDPDEPVREITHVLPNRADRRRAQRQARRGH